MLAEKLHIPHISTGDLLRTEIQNSTSIGLQAAEYMQVGELVPDSIMIRVLEERLRETDCKNGFILDGFPRTLNQATYLNTMLKRLNAPVDFVVSIEVDNDVIIDRLTQRQRLDDNPKTVKYRLDVYRRETAPLKDYYKREGQLKTIDGDASPLAVRDRILESIARNVSDPDH